MDVTDRAGNTSRYDSPEPVVLDLSRPKGKVVGVTGMGSKPLTPPQAN
jgi:hypothetical protein